MKVKRGEFRGKVRRRQLAKGSNGNNPVKGTVGRERRKSPPVHD